MSRGNIVATGSDVSMFGEGENVEVDGDFEKRGKISTHTSATILYDVRIMVSCTSVVSSAECPSNQQFSTCKRRLRTCDEQDESLYRMQQCEMGCECNWPNEFWHENRCIPRQECPNFDNSEQGGYKHAKEFLTKTVSMIHIVTALSVGFF